MSYYESALKLRPYVERAVQSLTDAESLRAVTLYPKWEDLVKLGSVEAEAGYKFFHDGKLYKCLQSNPAFQADWVPGTGTESLYTRIDEEHQGTEADPIPYEGNMYLWAGQYYAENGTVYRCVRDTGIPVYQPLEDLVGIYVEAVMEG